MNVIGDGECVVKVCINQHKVTGRRVAGGVVRPSDRDSTPGRGIGGGYRQARHCRRQREEKKKAKRE